VGASPRQIHTTNMFVFKKTTRWEFRKIRQILTVFQESMLRTKDNIISRQILHENRKFLRTIFVIFAPKRKSLYLLGDKIILVLRKNSELYFITAQPSN
jgi:hypothetical protein